MSEAQSRAAPTCKHVWAKGDVCVTSLSLLCSSHSGHHRPAWRCHLGIHYPRAFCSKPDILDNVPLCAPSTWMLVPRRPWQWNQWPSPDLPAGQGPPRLTMEPSCPVAAGSRLMQGERQVGRRGVVPVDSAWPMPGLNQRSEAWAPTVGSIRAEGTVRGLPPPPPRHVGENPP